MYPLKWGKLREFEIIPAPEKRDLLPRQKMAELMKETLADEKFIEVINDAESGGERKLQNYFTFISSEEDNLVPQHFNQQSQACLSLFQLDGLESFEETTKVLNEKIQFLLELEQKPSPTQFAINALKPMLPTFLLFSDEDRQLDYEYSVEELTNPQKSLRTLSELGDLNLNLLAKAITGNESGKIEGLLEEANDRLKTTFDGKWSQSPLEIKLAVKNNSLEVLLREGVGKYNELKLRSEGFRQFLSLISLASSLKEKNVVLLVDEIELHLHYDGQADLLQVLAEQDFANKVIYSTHSIGCLPEDLGGIKVIEREKDEFTSTIENKFWKIGTGFTPLLPKIGAEQLAFLPLRNAVIVEGAMDMLLLPTIFQQAIEQDHVGFLIAHGLSEQSLNQISNFEGEGLGVAYLTDCDPGGKKLHDELVKNVKLERLFHLPGDISKDVVTLEDLLTTDCLAITFNSVLTLYNASQPHINASDISEFNKISSLDKLAKERGIVSFEKMKIALAYEILSLIVDDPNMKIIDDKYLDGLKELHKNILDAVNN